jgi:hypothetical protein
LTQRTQRSEVRTRQQIDLCIAETNRTSDRNAGKVLIGVICNEEIMMETAQLIQAAASIVGPMAASQYGKFGGMDPVKIADIATTAVKIARAIESAATKP